MSIDPTAQAPASDSSSQEAMHRFLLQALATGSSGSASLKQLLARAPMSAEQQAVVDLLLSLDQEEEEQEHPDSDPPPRAAASEPGATEPARGDGSTTASLREELSDLREVNDTLAAALGACPVCWGGDRGCPDCAGRGHPGSRVPDRALFDELVIPAIRRLRRFTRKGSLDGSPQSQCRRS